MQMTHRELSPKRSTKGLKTEWMTSEYVGGVQRWHKEIEFNSIEDKKEEENTLKKKKIGQ